jgi:hypothetical protein
VVHEDRDVIERRWSAVGAAGDPSALETDHHGTQAKIIPMRTDRSADPRRPWSRGAVLVTTPWVPSK